MTDGTIKDPETGQEINIEDLIPKDVYALVKHLIAVLGSNAWIYMGLQMNPLTKSVTKDLNQARLAIDCAAALADKISAYVEEKERQELKVLIQNLQMNYVQHT